MNNQQEKKIKLHVLKDSTCYESVEKYNCACERKSCKQWLEFPQGKNCMILTTQAGPLTLNEIGKIYGLTRMRICQIEKNIYLKIRNFIQS
jgi:DNA-directed RNA polymerase sigma subunit (sigma70/sigma32)